MHSTIVSISSIERWYNNNKNIFVIIIGPFGGEKREYDNTYTSANDEQTRGFKHNIVNRERKYTSVSNSCVSNNFIIESNIVMIIVSIAPSPTHVSIDDVQNE